MDQPPRRRRAFALAATVLIGCIGRGEASGQPQPTPPDSVGVVSVEGAWLPARAMGAVALSAPPARLADLAFAAERLTAAERHELPALSSEERAELARSEKGLVKVGLTRRLDRAARVLGAVPAVLPGARVSWRGGLLERDGDGSTTWTTSFVSPGAAGIRLLFEEALVPGGRVYVYARSGEVHGPYEFDRPAPAEGFWTNTVFADEVFLEVQAPAGTAPRLTVAAIAHLEGGSLGSAGLASSTAVAPMSTSCFVDATCSTASEFAGLEQASRAAATLLFRKGNSFYACSGGLVATADHSFQPYLLTANHCFSEQSSASSLEAVFNYRSSACGGSHPSLSTFPRTLGATLLATSSRSDFTFVRLSQTPPAGSFFLGWTSEDYSRRGGTTVHRVSYPSPDAGIWPQNYSRHTISSVPSPGACSGYSQGNFIYSKDTVGGVASGSSGAPVFLSDGRIVGQLLGACGSNLDDDCDHASNSTVDGAFAVSYPQISGWLNPTAGGGGGGGTACVANAATLCLNGGRFKVEVAWRVASQGTGGSGTAVPLSGDTGYFWFFSNGNVELVVKVLDGRSLNGSFWVFYGALSDVEYTLTVTDTATGAVRTYVNPQGRMASAADTSAFR